MRASAAYSHERVKGRRTHGTIAVPNITTVAGNRRRHPQVISTDGIVRPVWRGSYLS